jgi:hypothetical protein
MLDDSPAAWPSGEKEKGMEDQAVTTCWNGE